MKSKTYFLNRLETELRQSPPIAGPPVDLHRSILGAVRAAGCPAPSRRVPGWGAMATAFALVLAVFAWWTFSRPKIEGHPVRNLNLALQESSVLSGQAPVVTVAPLTQELEFLSRDVRGVVEFLAASVP